MIASDLDDVACDWLWEGAMEDIVDDRMWRTCVLCCSVEELLGCGGGWDGNWMRTIGGGDKVIFNAGCLCVICYSIGLCWVVRYCIVIRLSRGLVRL